MTTTPSRTPGGNEIRKLPRAAAVVGIFAIGLTNLTSNTAADERILIGPATIVDGRTLRIDGETIRLAGVSVPPLGATCPWPRRTIACGFIARAAAMDLVAGVTDVECRLSARIENGFWLATCRADGFDLGRNLVHTGWAIANPTTAPRSDVAIEADSRTARRGLWNTMVPPH